MQRSTKSNRGSKKTPYSADEETDWDNLTWTFVPHSSDSYDDEEGEEGYSWLSSYASSGPLVLGAGSRSVGARGKKSGAKSKSSKGSRGSKGSQGTKNSRGSKGGKAKAKAAATKTRTSAGSSGRGKKSMNSPPPRRAAAKSRSSKGRR